MKIIKQDGWQGLRYGVNGSVTFKSNPEPCRHCIYWYEAQIARCLARMRHAKRFAGMEPVVNEFQEFLDYAGYMARVYTYLSEM